MNWPFRRVSGAAIAAGFLPVIFVSTPAASAVPLTAHK